MSEVSRWVTPQLLYELDLVTVMAIDNTFLCLDCAVDTSENDEYYMVKEDVWLQAHPGRDGMLCIGCLENRLGRKLTAVDFTKAPINSLDNAPYPLSERLRDRLRS